MATLKYAPFVSEIELPFYTSLANHKINIAKLDDSARQLWGLYEIRANQPKDEPCHMQIRANALAKTE
jgi:ubiquitin-like modifier-activating enzyme ATG7